MVGFTFMKFPNAALFYHPPGEVGLTEEIPGKLKHLVVPTSFSIAVSLMLFSCLQVCRAAYVGIPSLGTADNVHAASSDSRRTGHFLLLRSHWQVRDQKSGGLATGRPHLQAISDLVRVIPQWIVAAEV